MTGVIYLSLAIALETFGSTMLKISEGFTVLWPSIGVAIGFLASFTCLSFALKTIPLSTAYATWSGVGTALTALIGVFAFQESLSLIKVVALVLVIVGIVILNKAKEKSDGEAEEAA
ncbi:MULTISPECIES: DMT family transporter [Brevibacillus]|uniref:Multidrug resistance protein EbrB n=1 Tax=Brevibacillus borstelensis AK1 TaxID=1300222 RepID=M8DD78_9BACL|nr:multidrug efflux SMR transporter [Brevibacillus borstelensis]EMT51403.1 Multidrug resistance protein EbrB [Brevibacillus borstelensis AK1]KKX54931.1 multidrug transporter [Brevibacillus borstelensis cifa_chp40]MBE5396274.1 multidrug efflux SMR transporter [Brevibacillus borstelensis]MCC0564423.1 multidrug efflux SMR transporter [Brevibacillus borstelensis]MED1743782.1 multidrug efflux SMR transporter [Brevibacillus borstelensis]